VIYCITSRYPSAFFFSSHGTSVFFFKRRQKHYCITDSQVQLETLVLKKQINNPKLVVFTRLSRQGLVSVSKLYQVWCGVRLHKTLVPDGSLGCIYNNKIASPSDGKTCRHGRPHSRWTTSSVRSSCAFLHGRHLFPAPPYSLCPLATDHLRSSISPQIPSSPPQAPAPRVFLSYTLLICHLSLV
jgi:hypothetical protein